MKKKRIKTIELGVIHIDSFEVKKSKLFSWDYYYNEDDPFHDEKVAKQVKKCKPNEVVLQPNTPYELIIDYPTTTPYRKRFNTNAKGMTRLEFVDFICKHYKKMYREEDKSTNIPALLGKDGGNAPMFNRQETDGKYGIWGHSIGDLILVDATIDAGNHITLGVDS